MIVLVSVFILLLCFSGGLTVNHLRLTVSLVVLSREHGAGRPLKLERGRFASSISLSLDVVEMGKEPCRVVLTNHLPSCIYTTIVSNYTQAPGGPPSVADVGELAR